MKTILLFSTFLTMALSATATTIPSAKSNIEASSVDQLIRLVNKDQPGSSQMKVQVIVTDSGMSTDVSPRYTIYLGFASLAEMGNLSADFKISDQAYRFTSAIRKAAGIYIVKFVEYRDTGFVNVTLEIDSTNMFIAEKEMRKSCGGDFCDGNIETHISVKEISAIPTRN